MKKYGLIKRLYEFLRLLCRCSSGKSWHSCYLHELLLNGDLLKNVQFRKPVTVNNSKLSNCKHLQKLMQGRAPTMLRSCCNCDFDYALQNLICCFNGGC